MRKIVTGIVKVRCKHCRGGLTTEEDRKHEVCVVCRAALDVATPIRARLDLVIQAARDAGISAGSECYHGGMSSREHMATARVRADAIIADFEALESRQ